MNLNNFTIVHIEDDYSDVDLLIRVLKHMNFSGDIRHYVESDSFFHDLNHFKIPIKSMLVFLDIRLPGMDGKQLLAKIKGDAKLGRIPVIMISGSNSERDYIDCLRMGCNAYLVKSADWNFFRESCASAIKAWMYMAEQKFV